MEQILIALFYHHSTNQINLWVYSVLVDNEIILIAHHQVVSSSIYLSRITILRLFQYLILIEFSQ